MGRGKGRIQRSDRSNSIGGQKKNNRGPYPFDFRSMQPGMRVVLATAFWLAVLVAGTVGHHPAGRLIFDQYSSPFDPHQYGVYRRAEGQPDWKDQDPVEKNHPFDPSINPPRSITNTGHGTPAIRYVTPFNFVFRSLSLSLSSCISYPFSLCVIFVLSFYRHSSPFFFLFSTSFLLPFSLYFSFPLLSVRAFHRLFFVFPSCFLSSLFVFVFRTYFLYIFRPRSFFLSEFFIPSLSLFFSLYLSFFLLPFSIFFVLSPFCSSFSFSLSLSLRLSFSLSLYFSFSLLSIRVFHCFFFVFPSYFLFSLFVFVFRSPFSCQNFSFCLSLFFLFPLHLCSLSLSLCIFIFLYFSPSLFLVRVFHSICLRFPFSLRIFRSISLFAFFLFACFLFSLSLPSSFVLIVCERVNIYIVPVNTLVSNVTEGTWVG